MSLKLAAALALAVAALTSGQDAAAQCNKAYTTCGAPDLVAQLPAGCCSGVTCTLNGTITVPPGAVCDFNFGARHVVLSGQLATGTATVTIEAESFHVVGGQLRAVGQNANAGGKVTITTSGISAGSSFSLEGASASIDLSGQGTGGGMLTINAAGPVLLDSGSLLADGTAAGASGGTLMIDSTAGLVRLAANIFARAAQPAGGGGFVRVKGAGAVTLAGAKTILLDGGRAGGGTLDVDAALAVTFAAGSKVRTSAIDGSGGSGGDIQIAAAAIDMLGELRAEGGNAVTGFGGDGGSIELEARTGALHTELLSVEGASNGNGGEITLVTDSISTPPTDGTVRMSGTTSAQAKTGGGAGGIIDVIAAGGIVVEVGAPINVNGSQGGAGSVTMNALRDIQVNSTIQGIDLTAGGVFTIDGSRSTILNADVKMFAQAGFDGDGGEVLIIASRDFTLQSGKTIDVSGSGTFDGGTIEVFAGGNATVETNARMMAEGGPGGDGPDTAGSGGAIAMVAGDPDQSGNLTVRGTLSAGSRAPNGGTIELAGCTVTLSGNLGMPLPGPSSANMVTARTALTSSGNVRAELTNTAIIPVGVALPSNNGTTPPWTTTQRPVCTAPNTPANCLIPCPVCGNGVPEFPEQCDQSGDRCTTHCSPSCRMENCSNGVPCHQDLCDPQAGCFTGPAANGSACDDATVCNGRETCTSGACVAGPTPECDDGNPCTADCDPVQGCSSSPVPNGTSCADNNPCDGAEHCVAGVCEAGTLVQCPAGQSCVPATGACMATPCSPGPGVCNDDNPCTSNVCNGTCSNPPVANGTACPDSNVCNGAETCASGVCTPGDQLDLDDDNACTDDDCDPIAGPTHTPRPGCRPCITNPQCNDNNTCTTDTCLPNNTCDNTPIADCCVTAADCEDGSPCTTESCPAGTCSRANTPGPCGDACQPGTCQAGSCNLGTPVECSDDGNPCTVETCDPGQGCTKVDLEDCCNTIEACADSDACTTDTCDLEAHRCTNTRIDADCRACAVNDDCDPLGRCGQSVCGPGGMCVENTPPDCRDNNPNTLDLCVTNGAGEPACEHRCLNNAACNDGNVCNGDEACSNQTCIAGTAVACDDGDLCTDEACDPVAGCQRTGERTGFASVRCRLDTMVQKLAAQNDQNVAAKVRSKLSGLLAKADVKLDAAEAAGQGKQAVKALRALGKSLKMLSKVVRTAKKKRKIESGFADQLLDKAGETGRVVGELRASVI